MIELGSKEFWDRLASDPARLAAEICSVDLVRLDDTLQNQASLRAWVNATHESARIEESKAQYEVTKERARAILRAKEVKDPVTGKAKSVEILKAEVEVDEKVLLAESILAAAEQKRGVLRAMTSALEDRLQMLIQLSANQRKERENN